MAQRLIKEAILVVRNGKRVQPEIGKTFNLTDDEIKQLERVRPQAIAKVNAVEEDPQSLETTDSTGADTPVDLKDIDLDKMERPDLIALADSLNLKFAKNISTEKLIDLIRAEAGEDEGEL